MTQGSNTQKRKRYDLEDRTKKFAKDTRTLLRTINPGAPYSEDGRQLTRSSGSVGANYIEANEASSKKDFVYRIYICRKEAKESAFWLDVLSVPPEYEGARKGLLQEARELLKIFNAILVNSK